MLFNIELRRQCHPSHSDRCQPLTDRKAQAVQHSIRVSGCRMTEIQAQLYEMQTQQGVLVVIYS